MHPLYVIGVVCWLTFLVGGVLEAIYRAKALDGVSVDPVGLLFFSDVIETFGRGMMLILCILVANGWTFVGSEDGLSLSTIVALQLSVMIQIGCELMALIQQKPESSYTPYNGFWGMIAICIQMVIILTYIFNMHYTYNYRIYPQQKPFFLAFGLSTVAWCLALPTLFLIEEWCYAWERERILRFVEGCGRLVTMALISFWLHPTNLDSHIYFKPVVEQESGSVVPVERKQRTLKIGAGGIAYEDDDKYNPPLSVDASPPQQEIELAGWNTGISPSAGQRFM